MKLPGSKLVESGIKGVALATSETSTCTSIPEVALSIPVDHEGEQIAVQGRSVSRNGKWQRTTNCARDSRSQVRSQNFVRDD